MINPSELDNTALRLACAEAVGWTHDKHPDYDALTRPDGHYAGGATNDIERAMYNATVPNFPTSIDATHAALQEKDETFRTMFDAELENAAYGKNICELPARVWALCFLAVHRKLTQK